jgi:hypothetical protein
MGQSIQLHFPKFAISIDPLCRLGHRLRSQLQTMHSSVALTFDEAGIFKDAQVFRDGRKRNGERFSQIGDTTFGPSQKLEDPPSGRIGQRSEDSVERAAQMLNHMVKYCNSLYQCKQNLDLHWTCEPGSRRSAVPTECNCGSHPFPRATPVTFCSNLSSFSSVQLFDEKEACRNQEHRNQARCKHSSDHRRPHHLPGNRSGT